MIMYRTFICAFLITLASRSIAQSGTSRGVASSPFPQEVLSNNVVIEGQDKPYRNIRKEVERLFARKNHVGVIDIYKNKYFASFRNSPQKRPLYGFGWLYATYYREQLESKHPTKELNEAFGYVAQEPIPAVYDYVRLRFILQQMVSIEKSLRPLGERLLKVNPSDVGVKYQLARMIDPSSSPRDRQISIKYAAEMVKDKPNSASVWASYGATYYIIWLMTKSKLDSQKSIHGYRKYLSLAGKNPNPMLARRIPMFIKQMSIK